MHANMTHNGQKTNLSLVSSDANVNSSGQNEYSRNDVEKNVREASKTIFTKIPLLHENECETYFDVRGGK